MRLPYQGADKRPRQNCHPKGPRTSQAQCPFKRLSVRGRREEGGGRREEGGGRREEGGGRREEGGGRREEGGGRREEGGGILCKIKPRKRNLLIATALRQAQ